MPLIKGAEINKIIELFNKRGVKNYHACQYKDIKTYLQLGGVPSRNLMEKSGLPYTPFDTDNTDRNNEVWDKIFANLSDFGFGFAQGKRNENTAPTPNPYGPILLVFDPQVLSEASDVAICLRSAGGKNYSREGESLSSSEEVDRIFEHTIEEAPTHYAKAYIKYSNALKKEFNNDQAMTPEISCVVQNEKLSFRYLNRILVDAYTIRGQPLIDMVKKLHREYSLNGNVLERRYAEGRREIKQELATLLLQGNMNISEIINNEAISIGLKDWANRLIRGNIVWQYDRFARYLRSGTLLELYRVH